MAKISELLPQFLEYRDRVQNRTAATLKNDAISVRILMRAVGDIDPRNITPQHIDRLSRALSEGMAVATYNTRLSAVKAFMLWCRRRGHVPRDFDPVAELMYRKNVRPDRHRLPVTQFFQLLDAANNPHDRILAAIGLWLFLRVSETRHLRIKDVDLENGEIHVYVQKTQEYDIMPISSTLDRELRQWLTFYTENTADIRCEHEGCGPLCGEWYLVPGKDQICEDPPRDEDTGLFTSFGSARTRLVPDRPLGQNAARQVQRMLASIGFHTKQEGTHTLRRSGARAYFDSLVDSGFDGALKRVSSMLHHSSVLMTERYLGIREDRHSRNKDIKSSVMFPSIEDVVDDVITLRPRLAGE